MTSERTPRLSPSGARLSCDPGCLSGASGIIELGDSILFSQLTLAPDPVIIVPPPPAPATFLMEFTGPNSEPGNPITFWLDVTVEAPAIFDTPPSQVVIFLMRGNVSPEADPTAIVAADFTTTLFNPLEIAKGVLNTHDLSPPDAFQIYSVWIAQAVGAAAINVLGVHMAAVGVSQSLFLSQP